MEVGMVTEMLNAFIGAFSGGFDRIRPAVGGLLRILLTLDVLFFALLILFDVESIKGVFHKILGLSLWTYVIQDFDSHARSVVNSLVQAGLMAAGQGGADPHVVLDPSRILERGFQVTAVLANNFPETSVFDVLDLMGMGFAFIFIMLAFGALALNAFLVVIEYYLALAVAGILMPFGVLKPTRWLAMKPVSFLVSSGLKLMVIAFIMAISEDVVGRLRFSSDEPSLRELWIMVAVTGTLSMVAWIAPQRLAAGFMAGAASLGGGDGLRFGGAVASGAASAVAPIALGARRAIARLSPKAGHVSVRSDHRSWVSRSSSSSGAAPFGAAQSGPPKTSPLAASSSTAAPRSAVQAPELVPASSTAPRPVDGRFEAR